MGCCDGDPTPPSGPRGGCPVLGVGVDEWKLCFMVYNVCFTMCALQCVLYNVCFTMSTLCLIPYALHLMAYDLLYLMTYEL